MIWGLVPETLVRRKRFIKNFKERTIDHDLLLTLGQDLAAAVVERGIGFVVARGVKEHVLAHGKYDAADVRPVDRACAHAARLGAGVQRAVPQKLLVIGHGRAARDRGLGMRGAVVRGHFIVGLLDQDVAFRVGEQCAERVVARGATFVCKLKRAAQQLQIAFVGDSRQSVRQIL